MAKAVGKTSMGGGKRPFVFLHVGDLHLVVPEQDDGRETARYKQRLAQDVDAIFEEIATLRHRGFDFVYLPGDIADDGTAEQYAILAKALDDHPVRTLHLIPGDHDRQHGCMAAFGAFRARTRLPLPAPNHVDIDGTVTPLQQYYYADDIAGVRCIFLDMISAGYGRKGVGLDFRLGDAQKTWLADEIRQTLDAEGAPKIPCAVFMHTYPADLQVRSEATDVAGAIWSGHVRLVEMGHTHYNEITPDGRTHYAAARSVGQNEDGSVGYAVCALDGDVVSWRFKPLDKGWPFVVITSPADRRVATQGRGGSDTIALRALVLSDQDAVRCKVRVDDGFWIDMTPPASGDRCFTASVPWPAGSKTLSVIGWHPTPDGKPVTAFDIDAIEPVEAVLAPRSRPHRIGGDDLHLHAWPEKGLRGDQLGPNRAGRDW